MEIEVKLRLPDQQAYDRFKLVMMKQHVGQPHTLHQHNYFFDGQRNELRPSKTAVRLRQENNSSGGSKFILTVKSRLRIEGGVSVAEENEQEVDQSVANRILSDPHNVFATDSSLTANGIHLKVLHELVKAGLITTTWQIYGSFLNERISIPWINGLIIELDRTTYPSMGGQMAFEIEMECSLTDSQQAKTELERILLDNDIRFTYSKRSKLHNMISGSIDD